MELRLFIHSFPTIAVDQKTGYVYVAYVQDDGVDSVYDYNVYFTRSTNSGETWDSARIATDPDSAAGYWQFFPWLSVDHLGVIHLAYYDNRSSTSSDTLVDVYLAQSTDTGTSFDTLKLTFVSSDPFQGTNGLDYIGITSTICDACPTWTDFRNLNEDIYLAHVSYYSDLDFVRGDANADGKITGADATYITAYLYLGGAPPPCMDAADANDIDGRVTVADRRYIIHYVYGGGPPPPPPCCHIPDSCGSDPTTDTLDCACYPPCMGLGILASRSTEFGGNLWLGEATLTEDKLSVTVYLENTKALDLFGWKVDYDPKLLTAESIDNSGLITEKFDFFGAKKNIEEGWIRPGAVVSWTMEQFLPPGRYQVATMVFALKANQVDLAEVLSLNDIELVDSLGTILMAGTSGGPMSTSSPTLPNVFTLLQSRPNPFATEAVIAYIISKTGRVSLKIYDSSGRLVRTLVNEKEDAGCHTHHWDGKTDGGQKVSAGIYFCRLSADKFTATKKMALLR